MFQLVVYVCVATSACETIKVPFAYATEARCAEQAAIVAGMARARYRSARALSYDYTCAAKPKTAQAAKKGQVASKER
ncbi:MAG TPA: hypothetical protein VD978_09215 [Azospirillum sp.]|nr:hypothetical protein [Azospirillum sp.]